MPCRVVIGVREVVGPKGGPLLNWEMDRGAARLVVFEFSDETWSLAPSMVKETSM